MRLKEGTSSPDFQTGFKGVAGTSTGSEAGEEIARADVLMQKGLRHVFRSAFK